MGPSVIGNFDKPAKTDPLTWMVKHSDKVALCSSARALAGGSVAGDGVEADPGPKGKEIAPFNFRGMKPKVYDEITSGANGRTPPTSARATRKTIRHSVQTQHTSSPNSSPSYLLPTLLQHPAA